MAETTGISWTDATFNCWRGCQRVAPGCTNCYAEALSKRNPSTLGTWGPDGVRVVAAESYWRQPVIWNRKAEKVGERKRVFCASLADVFEDWNGYMTDTQGKILRANAWLPSLGRGAGDHLTMSHVRERLGELIRGTPHLDWQLLTKRPENANGMATDHMFGVPVDGSLVWPRNVWCGVTVENKQHGLPRIDILRKIPAAVRFLSVEPLLEDLGQLDLRGIHWVIVGSESGGKRRSMELMWVLDIQQQCEAAGVKFFMKQAEIDGRVTGDMGRFPLHLRVREFPEVVT